MHNEGIELDCSYLHRAHLPLYTDKSQCPCVLPCQFGVGFIGEEMLGVNRDNAGIVCLPPLHRPPQVISSER